MTSSFVLTGISAQVEEAPACVPQRVLIKFRAPWLNMYADRIAVSLGAREEDALPQNGANPA